MNACNYDAYKEFGEENYELVYLTLWGELRKEWQVPGVPIAFGSNTYCDKLYAEMLDAYERLRDRLDVVDEDDDVEVIIDSLLHIERYMSEQMFYLGMRHEELKENISKRDPEAIRRAEREFALGL